MQTPPQDNAVHPIRSRIKPASSNNKPDSWRGTPEPHETRIGTGVVIRSGAIVTRNVPDYWIVTGMPAKPMLPRFTESIITRLLALAWWEWPHGALRAALTDFRSLPAEDFLARYDAK